MAAGARGKPRFEKDQKTQEKIALNWVKSGFFMCFQYGNAVFITRRDTIAENGW
jgi:hypothetical protein